MKKHEGHVSMNFDESCSWQREALRLLEKALAQLRDLFASAELGSHLKSSEVIEDHAEDHICLAGAWPVVVAISLPRPPGLEGRGRKLRC